MSTRRARAVPVCVVLALVCVACGGAPRPEPALHAAVVEERLGERVPGALRFQDADGRPVRFGDLVDGRRPTVLVLAYLRCRNLCGRVLDGAADALRESGLVPGVDFHAVTVSIDPRDTRQDARAKRAHVLARIGAPVDGRAWRFLLGDETAIRGLAEAVGFGYRYDAGTDQYAHAAVLVLLTPDGTVSGYIYGIRPAAEEVAAAVRAAAAGRTASSLDRVLLRCFRYVPALRRHAGLIAGLLAAGAAATLAGLGILLGRLWLRELRSAAR